MPVLDYAWSRSGGTGPSVVLSGATSSAAQFTPTVAGTYTFTLTVAARRGGSGTDAVTITVQSVCSGTLTRTLDLHKGPNTIAIPIQPCGATYTAADLLEDTGSPFVTRCIEGIDGLGTNQIFLPGLTATPFEIDGAHGYVIFMSEAKTLTYSGEIWPQLGP